MRAGAGKGAVLATLVAALACLPAAAPAAAAPPQLWQSPSDGEAGSGAGQFLGPNGIGVEAATPGHLFVADTSNFRIAELDAWGQFERAWGWEAVASGPGDDPAKHEEQQLTVSATTGTYRLSYFNAYKPTGSFEEVTDEIPFDASASAVQAALVALASLEPGDVIVSGGPGDASGSSPYAIEFAGEYADTAIPELAADASELIVPVGRELTCESPEATAETTYRWLSDGAPATGPGSNSDTYTTVAADEGSSVQCQVFKSNADGVGSTQASNPAQVVAPAPATPAPVAPAIASPQPANPIQGTTLTCDGNETNWEGSPTLSFQWYRNGQEIPGATEDTYTLIAEDVEAPAALQCAVTGTNASGAVTALSRNRATGSPPGAPHPEAPGGNSGAFVVSVDNGAAIVTTTQEGGSFEVCVPGDGDVCQSGQGGGYGAGGFTARGGPGGGVAVDGSGDVYVFETATIGPAGASDEPSLRVQKFDNDGEFLLMWGGEVNKTSGADRCTKADLEAGDTCGAGAPGSGPGQFEGGEGNRIAIGPEGNVFVGDKERIQRFDPEGNYLGEVALPGQTVRAMAIDGAGNFYLIYVGEDDVRKLSPAGALLAEFDARDPRSVAVGSDGDVYVVENPFGAGNDSRILGYEPDGSCFICAGESFRATAATNPIGLATSTACGIPGEDLYASFSGSADAFLRAYGPPPDPTIPSCEPPEVPPGIEDQFASSVSTDRAVLGAEINPRFWSGPVLGPTTYYVQYATAACIEAGGWEAGCVKEHPSPPGKVLEAEAVSADIPAAPIAVSGLSPDTAYRYRFVAESKGGGPVFGKGGTEEADGAEGSFTTFRTPPGPRQGCANDPLRSGSAALLPDCRAYEMVSPAQKGNADIVALTDAEGNRAALDQSSVSGDAFTYSSFRAFGGAQSGPTSSQYLARRGEGGWASKAIDPPQGINFLELVQSLNNKFKAFSPDLCEAWVFHGISEGQTLAAGEAPGFANLYRRENCGAAAGDYEALTSTPPPSRAPGNYFPELQGVSADGEQAIFRAQDKLTADAPDLGPGKGFGIDLLYEAHGEGQLRFVCLLPNGSPVGEGCVAGTAPTNGKRSYGREQAVDNAISADGSRIFWSEQMIEQNGVGPPGRLYVRIGGKETLRLSTAPAQYWTAAADGSAAIFTTGELKGGKATLHRYEVDAKKDEAIANEVYGVMGASEDAGRIYFASAEALEEGALEGEPNLYLYEKGEEEDELSFIATLSAEDAEAADEGVVTPLHVKPSRHAAQVTADGLAATFMSTASLTGAENTDLNSGRPDAEVFHYDAGSGQLRCVSCSPTGARPPGRQIATGTWAAAQIPGAQTQIYQVPRVLSSDGRRVFFESFAPLVANDTNGKADVYQWEQPGKGDCSEANPAFSTAAGGCVALISSGQSTSDSTISDASPSGEDVFFATAAPLLPRSDRDDLVDIYDARVLGGFPPPEEPPAPCEGEACQSPPPPPPAPTPASSAFEGPGNPVAGVSCAARARKAKSLSRRAKRLRRVARRAKAPRRSRVMRRKAKRLAKRAKRASGQAKRCRARARAARRAGR